MQQVREAFPWDHDAIYGGDLPFVMATKVLHGGFNPGPPAQPAAEPALLSKPSPINKETRHRRWRCATDRASGAPGLVIPGGP